MRLVNNQLTSSNGQHGDSEVTQEPVDINMINQSYNKDLTPQITQYIVTNRFFQNHSTLLQNV
jgi:hypothetical protein